MKYLYIYFFSTFFILYFTIISALEVGGHLTEDTTWSPENSPYEVIENLYIDPGVTLRILPGTEVKLSGAHLASFDDWNTNFWRYNNDSVAKMIWVEGRIIAEGTAEDSIKFTRLQNEDDYYWGTIYSNDHSELSSYEHCTFEYGAGMGIYVGRVAWATVSHFNGLAKVNQCKFANNLCGFIAHNLSYDISVTNSEFSYLDTNSWTVSNYYTKHISLNIPTIDYSPPLIANNNFICMTRNISTSSVFMIFNEFNDSYHISLNIDQSPTASYLFKNNFTNFDTAIDGGLNSEAFYIKNNNFINDNPFDFAHGIDLREVYIEVTNNYFENCNLKGSSDVELNGFIGNNIIINSNSAISGRFEEVYNNVFTNCNKVKSVIGSSNIFSSNILINNQELCDLIADNCIIENSIIFGNSLSGLDIMNNPVFRNCIIDFPLEPPLVDGGGQRNS